MSLYNDGGGRKYLTPGERRKFLRAARSAPPDVRTFCETLTHTGCRISEALALTAGRVDLENEVLILESLKKRRRGIYRAIPVPPAFLHLLAQVHNLPSSLSVSDQSHLRIWNWSRTTAWRRVCEVMLSAGIEGSHATPKGLRHGLGVHAVSSGVPLNMLQKWLGHSQIATTAIYANAMGPEEKRIAERMWGSDAA